jgi:hypothetical protein
MRHSWLRSAGLLACVLATVLFAAEAGARAVKHVNVIITDLQPQDDFNLHAGTRFGVRYVLSGAKRGDRLLVEIVAMPNSGDPNRVHGKWVAAHRQKVGNPRNGRKQQLTALAATPGIFGFRLVLVRGKRRLVQSTAAVLRFKAPKLPPPPPGFTFGAPTGPPPTSPPGFGPPPPPSGPPPVYPPKTGSNGQPPTPPPAPTEPPPGVASDQARIASGSTATGRSQYGPNDVGCGGTLSAPHYFRNIIEVQPNVYVSAGSQWWMYNASLYKWTSAGWVTVAQSPTYYAYITAIGSDITNFNIGPGSDPSPLAHAQFQVNQTGYYYPVVAYAYIPFGSNRWVYPVWENQSSFTQYNNLSGLLNGYQSGSCEGWQTSDGSR